MSDVNIEVLLNRIQTAVYGEDMRKAIHDAIEQCYDKLNKIEAELNELKK